MLVNKALHKWNSNRSFNFSTSYWFIKSLCQSSIRRLKRVKHRFCLEDNTILEGLYSFTPLVPQMSLKLDCTLQFTHTFYQWDITQINIRFIYDMIFLFTFWNVWICLLPSKKKNKKKSKNRCGKPNWKIDTREKKCISLKSGNLFGFFFPCRSQTRCTYRQFHRRKEISS